MSFVVGTRQFATKKEMQSHFSTWLKSREFGEFIYEGDDFVDLCGLVERHPNADAKIGCGIEAFTIRPHSVYLSKSIWILRIDGTETDFSYKTCVTSKQTTINQKIASAARSAVNQEIQKRKARFFNGEPTAICQKTGKQMTVADCHAHHAGYEFSEIVRKWVYETRLNLDEHDFVKSTDGKDLTTFADESIAKSFSEYHWLIASIEFVHKDHHVEHHSEKRGL